MNEKTLGKLLTDASSSMLTCGKLIEKSLKHTLNIADKCGSATSLVVADTLTKLTRDIGAAPIFFAEKTKADGSEMRQIVELLSIVLKKVQPHEAESMDEIKSMLKQTKKASEVLANWMMPYSR